MSPSSEKYHITWLNVNAEKFVKRLFGGEKGAEAILKRLDRLTSDEAWITAAETFEIVCGLFQNMRVVMDGKQIVFAHRALIIENPWL